MKRIEFDYLEEHFPHRPSDAHKGTMGSLVAITGSCGFSGAAVLSAKSALHSGVGLVYQVLPECIYQIFASSVYEAVCVPVKGKNGTVCTDDMEKIAPVLQKASAVLIGCGLGNNDDTFAVVKNVIKNATVPVIVDADGINVLQKHINVLDEAQAELVLTPHIKEFSRLSGFSVEEILSSPQKSAESFSKQHPKLTLVLKGHRTYIAKNGEAYENIAGNSGMAKGGSGDVLAGIISSLTAQGAKPFEAAVMGVHIHALSGDIAAAKLSRTAMLPSDIIDALPEIYTKIEDSRIHGA